MANAGREQGRKDQWDSVRPRPGLAGTLVVLLLSAALTIFTFWIATRLSGSPVLEHLPVFIADSYKALWSSAAAGTTGLGLALVKAFTERDKIQPDYLKLIGITTACLIALAGITVAAFRLAPGTNNGHREIPDGVSRITEHSNSESEFDLAGPTSPVEYVKYSLQGRFKIANGKVIGHLEKGTLSVAAEIPRQFPQKVQAISFRACFLERRSDADQMNVFPGTSRSRDSIDVDLPLSAGAKLTLPAGDFVFPLPQSSQLDRAWLCAAIKTDVNSYFPAQ